MNGDEPLLPQLRASGRFSLLVGGPIEREEVATGAEQHLIDGTEQSCRGLDVSELRCQTCQSDEWLVQPLGIVDLSRCQQTGLVPAGRFQELPTRGSKQPEVPDRHRDRKSVV